MERHRENEHLFSHIRMIQSMERVRSEYNAENIMLSEGLMAKAFPVNAVEYYTFKLDSDVVSIRPL